MAWDGGWGSRGANQRGLALSPDLLQRSLYKNPWEDLPRGQPGEGLDRLPPPPLASEHLSPETVSTALGCLLCSSKLSNRELDGGNLWAFSSGRASEMPRSLGTRIRGWRLIWWAENRRTGCGR